MHNRAEKPSIPDGIGKPDARSCAEADALVRSLVANELDAIRTALDDLGADLCVHPAIVESYTETLQSLDELAQRNENLARLLRADALAAGLESITLDSLRQRLVSGVR